MASDFLSNLLAPLTGSAPATPSRRVQAQTDARDPQDAQVAAGGPPLPEGPGAAEDALSAALAQLQPPFAALQHSLDQAVALLLALQPRRPIYETLNVDAITGISLNTRGRDFVGIRTSITTPSINFQHPTGLSAAVVPTSNFTYFALADGTRLQATAGANAGNYEFVYTDQIGGAVPQ